MKTILNTIKLVSAISLIFFTSDLYSQRNFTLYHLEGAPQNHYMNPSFKPASDINISLPIGMQSASISHSGFALNDLIHPRAEDDSLEVRLDLAIEEMADLNHFNLDVQNELLGFGFRVGENYFSLGILNRMQFNLLYPKDLFKLIYEGNGRSLLGERASFDGMGLNVNSYMEYGVGYNRVIDEDLMIGGRVKFISGMANIHTERSIIGLYTDPETFDLTVDGSARVNSSNITTLMNEENQMDFSQLSPYATNFANFGLGFDLGATYVVSDKLKFSASMNDLGFINWKSNNLNYESEEIDFHYRGIELNGLLEDSLQVFQNLVDTLGNVFTASSDEDSYTTSLYTRFYLGGRYLINEKIGATVLLYNEIVNKRYRAGFHVGVNAKLGQWLSACVNYGYYGRSWSNIGIGFSLRGGPVQYFLGVDNIMGPIHFESQKNFHVTTGLTIMIGKPEADRDLGTLKFK